MIYFTFIKIIRVPLKFKTKDRYLLPSFLAPSPQRFSVIYFVSVHQVNMVCDNCNIIVICNIYLQYVCALGIYCIIDKRYRPSIAYTSLPMIYHHFWHIYGDYLYRQALSNMKQWYYWRYSWSFSSVWDKTLKKFYYSVINRYVICGINC